MCVEATLTTVADAEIKTRRGTMQQTKKCNALQDNAPAKGKRGWRHSRHRKREREGVGEGRNALMKMAKRERGRQAGTQSVPALFSFQKLLRFRMLNYGH